MRNVLIDLLGIAGLGMLFYGLYIYNISLAFVVVGIILFALTIVSAIVDDGALRIAPGKRSPIK